MYATRPVAAIQAASNSTTESRTNKTMSETLGIWIARSTFGYSGLPVTGSRYTEEGLAQSSLCRRRTLLAP